MTNMVSSCSLALVSGLEMVRVTQMFIGHVEWLVPYPALSDQAVITPLG
jgi:hypothetical protein